MDEAQKKAALEAADQKITEAEQALETAKADLKTAQEAGDDPKITAAEGKVTTATETVTKAKADKANLEAGDVDDLIDDATRPPKLKDGTPGDKDIKVPKDKFDDLNEKAKLFEQFSPLLSKLRDNPAIIDRLMANDDPNLSVTERLKALEERHSSEKRTEISETIKAAAKLWPDFKSRWDDIKPILAGLQAQGVPYRDAVQRSYFAVNPDAASQGKKLIEIAKGRDAENRRGKMGPGGGGGAPIVGGEPQQEYQMTDDDKDFALKAGVNPELYQKHADWIEKFKDL